MWTIFTNHMERQENVSKRKRAIHVVNQELFVFF